MRRRRSTPRGRRPPRAPLARTPARGRGGPGGRSEGRGWPPCGPAGLRDRGEVRSKRRRRGCRVGGKCGARSGGPRCHLPRGWRLPGSGLRRDVQPRPACASVGPRGGAAPFPLWRPRGGGGPPPLAVILPQAVVDPPLPRPPPPTEESSAQGGQRVEIAPGAPALLMGNCGKLCAPGPPSWSRAGSAGAGTQACRRRAVRGALRSGSDVPSAAPLWGSSLRPGRSCWQTVLELPGQTRRHLAGDLPRFTAPMPPP